MGINFKHIVIVFRKELLDILRDRRTIYAMVIIPMLFMPVITVGVSWFMKRQMHKLETQQAVVMVIGADKFPLLMDELRKDNRLQIIDTVVDTAKAMQLLREESIRAVVQIPREWTKALIDNGELPFDSIRVYYLAAKEESQIAHERVSEAIKTARELYIEATIAKSGISSKVLKPFNITQTNISTPSEMGGKIVGMLLPYMLIIFSLTGAMYPAIDLTAGEKERGTLETLLLSPASRTELVLGKFFTVMFASLVTALLTLSSMALTSSGIMLSVPKEVLSQMNIHITVQMVLTVLLLIIPLSATFSSLLMAIAILAKSYKEAQSYISPLMLIAIFPAMASIMPGMKTDLLFSLIPVLNVSMLIKDAFSGTLEPIYLLTAAGSTIVFAAIALRICVVTFRKESVLFRV